MNELPSSHVQYQKIFNELAELVNSVPREKRESIRSTLGGYTHDLKHLLGLISGANAYMERKSPFDESDSEYLEMIDMIREAVAKINNYIDLLAENLNQEIFNQD